jgi:starch synthase
MKILFLSDDFPPFAFGGAGIIAFSLAQGLQKAGHEIFVITAVEEREKEGWIEYEGLKIFRIYSHYHPRWRAYLSLYNFQTVPKIKKIIREIGPEIVHAHNIHTHLSYHSLKIAKQQARAVFLTAHDTMLFHYGKLTRDFNCRVNPWQQFKEFKFRYNPLRNIIIRHYLKYVDKIFAISEVIKESLKQNDIYNVEVVYNGIDAGEWQTTDRQIKEFKKQHNLSDKKIVLFGGRLSALKGGEKIIQAMRIVVEKVPDAVLLVAGKTDGYAQGMIFLTRDLNIEKNILFLGWLERKDMRQAFFSCDICVTPSIYLDGFNLFNIEAMVSGKPVVGSCFGGAPEIIEDGVTGYIVNPLNVEMMAEKIIDLLNNPLKAKQFGEAGLKRAKEHFNMIFFVDRTFRWYERFGGLLIY